LPQITEITRSVQFQSPSSFLSGYCIDLELDFKVSKTGGHFCKSTAKIRKEKQDNYKVMRYGRKEQW
jgi:hypothetical protein